MTEPAITITERSRTSTGFRATVEFTGHARVHEITIVDPADEARRQLFSWYFEQFQTLPFFGADRRDAAERAMTDYGTNLFAQLFGRDVNDGTLYRWFEDLRERDQDRWVLKISGSGAFHRLHWEMLRNPADDAPLALTMFVERHTVQEIEWQLPPPGPSLNILVVAARPFGANDIDYQTISRTLIATSWNASRPVRIDLARPGTWTALRRHLEQTAGARRKGWYQVVHFDLHGETLDYAALRRGIDEGRFAPSQRTLRGYQGEQAFLYFETADDGVADPVPAKTVATLLREHKVTIAMVNACQSARVTENGDGMARSLAAAGVPVAVGMAYSVTVSAVEHAVPVLYEHLADGHTPREAVQAARRELFHDPNRTIHNRTVELQDWMLPVLFQQQEITVALAEMGEAERSAFRDAQTRGGPEPDVFGRDIDVLAVERRMLDRDSPNELIVHGGPGVGKSAFLDLLAWWWQRTGLVSRVFRFSFDGTGLTPQAMVARIAADLPGTGDETTWNALLGGVANRLRSERHLLVVDGLTGLDPAGVDTFRQVLEHLRKGRTLVLIGSRTDEARLGTTTIQRYELGPLTAGLQALPQESPPRLDPTVPPGPGPGLHPQPESEPHSQPTPDAPPEPVPAPKPDSRSAPTPSPRSVSMPGLDPDPVPAPHPQPVSTPDPEPDPDSDPDPLPDPPGPPGPPGPTGTPRPPWRAVTMLGLGGVALALALTGGYLTISRAGDAGAAPTPSSSTPVAATTSQAPAPARTVDPPWAQGDAQVPGITITSPRAGAGVEACIDVAGTAEGLAPNETILIAVRRHDRFPGEPYFLFRIADWEKPGTPARWSARVTAGQSLWQDFDILVLVGDRERILAAWHSGNMTSDTEIEGLRRAADVRVHQTGSAVSC
ncbi:CHAT domain-containing protein [Catenuloplanes sp. NPDC051500]|uniref:CHAT domain-containing protein n=1 Tax=Catenuloplanes sp. NPDC051500 TaxID=3363959 RepID=UPI00379B16FE